ncbi:MAG: MerR family transcriptional regulator [Polyangiales bacterium]
MGDRRTYHVKEIAALASVSVRTLHHYDAIGLLSPSRRTATGYRLYDDDDVLRLQQVLIQRELGLSLEQIKRALDDPAFDRRAALARQRVELAARSARTAAMLRAVDVAIAAIDQTGATMKDMTGNEIQTLFDGFDPAQHEDEARARWGETEAYAESARRTRAYTEADWRRYREEAHAIMSAAAALLRAGAPCDGEEARAVVARHRQSIDQWFYPCSPAMHAKLADLYEADARFAANIDVHAEGLTPWLAAAIRAASA